MPELFRCDHRRPGSIEWHGCVPGTLAKAQRTQSAILRADPSRVTRIVTVEADMQLPPGKTCQDCRHFRRCEWMLGAMGSWTQCDWSPSQFEEVAR